MFDMRIWLVFLLLSEPLIMFPAVLQCFRALVDISQLIVIDGAVGGLGYWQEVGFGEGLIIFFFFFCVFIFSFAWT